MEIRIPTKLRTAATPTKPETVQPVNTVKEVDTAANLSNPVETERWGRTIDGKIRAKPGPKPKTAPLALKDRYSLPANPTGLYPTAHVKVFARPYTEEAVTILVEIMRDHEAPVQARVSAATQVLDRAWGKPKETLELEAPAEGLRKVLNDISSEDLTDLVRALRNPPIDVTPTQDAKKPGP